MNEPQRRTNWRQFSLSSMLLIVTAIAAFLAGRGSAHREMVNEIATLRNEIQAKSATAPVRVRAAIIRSRVPVNYVAPSTDDAGIKSFSVTRVGPISEQTSQAAGSSRYLNLVSGKLQWSHRRPGESGYFYFKYGGPDQANDPVWQFAKSRYGSIEEFDGQPLSVRFYNASSSSIGANGRSIRVAVGDVWLARPLSDPDTIYAIQILQQEKQEAMTAKYAVLHDGTSTREN